MRRALATIMAALVAAFAVSGPAWAGGSDDLTPYTVTAQGIAFPAPLAAHGHVNVRLADGTARGLHFDPNNGHPGAQWIGATFLPWSALGITAGCIAWVQWSDTNEHYGEGGQAPVCTDTPTTPPATPEPTKEPTWTPAPEPSVVPSQSTPSEQPSQPSEPSPTSSETPDEPTPPVEPTSEPEPQPSPSSTSPTSTPTPSSEPSPDDEPSPWPGDVDHPVCEPGLDPECDAGDPCSVDPEACFAWEPPTDDPADPPTAGEGSYTPVDPTPETTPTPVTPVLPQTGARSIAAVTLAAVLALAGTALLITRRRTP